MAEYRRSPFRPRVYEDSRFVANLVGYVPVELVAVHLFVSSNLWGVPEEQRPLVSWGAASVLAVLTPFYIRLATTSYSNERGLQRGPWRQVIASTIAFPVWVFATGGPFEQMAWYTDSLGAIVLAVVSVLLPLVFPAPGARAGVTPT